MLFRSLRQASSLGFPSIVIVDAARRTSSVGMGGKSAVRILVAGCAIAMLAVRTLARRRMLDRYMSSDILSWLESRFLSSDPLFDNRPVAKQRNNTILAGSNGKRAMRYEATKEDNCFAWCQTQWHRSLGRSASNLG